MVSLNKTIENKKTMENKTTTELLDLLFKLDKKSEKDVENVDWKQYDEINSEIQKRFPFNKILGELDDPNDYSLEERIENLEADVKKLKRHKHDEKNGDVLIRI